jgi:hypothetical protein
MMVFPILGAGIAGQVLKSLVHASRRKQRSLSLFADLESFPNFHAVIAGSLSFQVGEASGFGSVEFAVASMLTLVLLYDTAGVKRAAGDQAWLLNRLLEVRAGSKPLIEIPSQSTVRTWGAALFGLLMGWALERAWLALGLGTW